MIWKVTATSLNLRSEPRVASANRIAVLPNGHTMEKLGEADADWWSVATNLGGGRLEGFVASKHLAEESGAAASQPTFELPPVHLAENKPSITRHTVHGRAFPLGEPDRPSRSGSTPQDRARQLHDIIEYLDVEHNVRYRAGGGATFCNIYAYDYCYLSGVYLPRVWWTSKAIAQLATGLEVPVRFGETVRELNANSLHNWLQDFGPEFGWIRVASESELQDAANQGKVAIVCAQRADLNKSGHICAVVLENPPHEALRKNGSVHLPLQSQAGATNFCYSCGTSKWWAQSKFRSFGFWLHN